MELGICGWGIGGLSLYEQLKLARPDLSVTYIDDYGSTPYTLMTRQELEDRMRQILTAFRNFGVEQVVVASDAAGTVLNDISIPGLKTIGLIEPTLKAIKNRHYKEVGIIGGRRTILSGAYGRSLRKMHFCVLQRISLDLSQLVESGGAFHPEIPAVLTELLEPLLKVDCLLLASPHYRALAPAIKRILPDADLVIPTDETVSELLRQLPQSSGGKGTDTFYTTADPVSLKEHFLQA